MISDIDNIDYSVESKEQKRKISEELILSENTPIEDRVPAADIASNVLKRISVKNNKGEWVQYKDVEKSQQKYVKEEINRLYIWNDKRCISDACILGMY